MLTSCLVVRETGRNMFRVRAIQVEHGDSLLVSYGDTDRLRHLLIDGGPAGSAEVLRSILNDERGADERLRLEALVITHYDLDHIEGVIELLSNMPPWLDIADIWFNGRRHLPDRDKLGPRDGDILTRLIDGKFPWNTRFSGDVAGALGTIEQACPSISLDGGLEVRVLSPDRTRLLALASAWRSDTFSGVDKDSKPRDTLGRSDVWPPKAFNATQTRFVPDESIPNGSSIALLLTFEGKRVLLASDAFSEVVKAGLELHLTPGTPVDLLKVSHHGSKANTDPELLKMIKCKKFLISTSGKIHKHPDHALIARLISKLDEPEIFFNYGVDWPGYWRSRPTSWPVFLARYPEGGQRFVDVVL